MMTLTPAVFLDRDNTVLHDPGFLRNPDLVAMLPGAGTAIARLNAAGIPVVIITNQSGLARGTLSQADYDGVTKRMHALLDAAGAHLDGVYYCPHLPEITGPCTCRKPGPKLYEQAAADLNIDLGRSWYVGDRLTDALAATTFGGMGIVLESGTCADQDARERGYHVVKTLEEVATEVIASCTSTSHR